LDEKGKGFADLDDLTQLLEQNFQEPHLSLINKLVGDLEFKNKEKVYYSPLFGLPQPYFRFGRRFDSFGIIEKFNKELSAIDSYDRGFVALGLFRSVLEHELKIKEKIVDDFIQSMRDGVAKEGCNPSHFLSLDANAASHAFKNHIDYVVLLRKLVMYFDTRTSEKSQTNLLSGRSHPESLPSHDEMLLKVDIESAIRLKNPVNELEAPNALVVMRVPFEKSIPAEICT